MDDTINQIKNLLAPMKEYYGIVDKVEEDSWEAQ